MEINLTPIVITAIICATLVLLCIMGSGSDKE